MSSPAAAVLGRAAERAAPHTPGPASPSAGVRPRVSARTRRLAELGVLLTVLIWSANFVIVKASIGVLGPLTFTAARYIVASATLLAILWRRQGTIRPPAGETRSLLVLGVVGFGCYQVLWTTGLTQIGAGDSALIVAASPVIVALLAGAVGMDRLSAPKLVGALIAFAGVAVVIGAGQGLSLGSSLVGDALTLAAATLWAVYTVGGTRILKRVDPLRATAWTVVAGAAMLVPLGVAEAAARPPSGVTPASVVAIVYSGALAAGIANVFVFNAIRYVGPTRATAMQFLVPAGAVVLGAVVLAEPVGPPQVVGGAIIVAGVLLTRRPTVLPASVRTRLPSIA
jgi:drug/metabolite transporter (DMT)-like permease